MTVFLRPKTALNDRRTFTRMFLTEPEKAILIFLVDSDTSDSRQDAPMCDLRPNLFTPMVPCFLSDSAASICRSAQPLTKVGSYQRQRSFRETSAARRTLVVAQPPHKSRLELRSVSVYKLSNIKIVNDWFCLTDAKEAILIVGNRHGRV